ncbi:MAG: hypothetical protein GKR90_02510 [Pseudomonadales bacterium]|nr:hypothetical protein [Pseudomonadales bacterium]
MNPTYAVYTHIDRPIDQVFNAVVDRTVFEKLIFPSCSGDLVEGETVTWDNGEWACDVHVDKVILNEKIEISFKPSDFAIPALRQGDKRDYVAKIVFLFEPADVGGTLITLCEYGWETDRRSVLQSYGQCGGWQEMLMCLKAQMVFGVDLRSPRTARPNYEKLWSN